MYRISQLAEKVGLSRSTLLYYEKLGLICAIRAENKYRYYDEKDVQRIKLLQQLQSGGLTLNECLQCLDEKVNKSLLKHRLDMLDNEIQQKQNARELLASMLGESSMSPWHSEMNEQAPQAHIEWLIKQGFSEKQALRLNWLSKDMNQHDSYMTDFETIFSELSYLGPSSEQDTLRALTHFKLTKGALLDIGCGKGASALTLANNSQFTITALDNDEHNLKFIDQQAKYLAIENAPKTLCASMTHMPFSSQTFDVLWCEGSAYIMGIEQALKEWRDLMKPNGYLVFSDLIWLTDTPQHDVTQYWKSAYPAMTTLSQMIKTIKKSGYTLIDSFTLSEQAWQNYLTPLEQRIKSLSKALTDSKALNDLNQEIEMHKKYLGQYGYKMFILGKN